MKRIETNIDYCVGDLVRYNENQYGKIEYVQILIDRHNKLNVSYAINGSYRADASINCKCIEVDKNKNGSNQKGFGLIEVMIGVVLMTIVALGTATLLNYTLLVSQTAQVKTNLTSLVTSTMGVASNTVTCTQAITMTPQTYSPDLIQFNGLGPGVVLQNYNLAVAGLTFNAPQLVMTGFDGTTVYQGTLTLSATPTVPIYGSVFKPRPILGIYITVSPSNVITGCGSIMPTLPSAPTNPVVPINYDATPSNSDNIGCTYIGGVYANGTCSFPNNIAANSGGCDHE